MRTSFDSTSSSLTTTKPLFNSSSYREARENLLTEVQEGEDPDEVEAEEAQERRFGDLPLRSSSPERSTTFAPPGRRTPVSFANSRTINPNFTGSGPPSPIRPNMTGTRYGAALTSNLTGNLNSNNLNGPLSPTRALNVPRPASPSKPPALPLSPKLTGSTGWSGRSVASMLGSGTPLCARCQKPVYFAEQVKASGKVFHKPCLKCTECETRLDSSKLAEKDGRVICRNCYSRVSTDGYPVY